MVDRKLTQADRRAAENLKRLFDRAKEKSPDMTQASLASDLGWETQAAVSQYINAVIPLGIEATLKFAEYFLVEPAEIRDDFKYSMPAKSETRTQSLALSNEALVIAKKWSKLPRRQAALISEMLDELAKKR